MGEGLVKCDDQATAFIAVGDKLKENLGFIALFDVAYIINDQHWVFPGGPCRSSDPVLVLLFGVAAQGYWHSAI